MQTAILCWAALAQMVRIWGESIFREFFWRRVVRGKSMGRDLGFRC